MILGWSPFKIVSVSDILYPRWLPSSNGQNCSILRQKVPKFELYKHNDELCNIYYRIFYELWTFADFDRLRRFLRNQPIIKKNGLWWPCLLTDRDEMSKVYRWPSKDASYQVLIHLARRFQRRRFLRNQPIRNKNGLWRPLLMDRDEISNLYRGPPIDASYQVSVHLVKQFQRRRFLKIGQSEIWTACGGHVC